MGDDHDGGPPDARLDIEARWALLLPLREHMLAVARRRCISEEDAEDCVQEAMLRAVHLDRLDPARVEALLTSITTRLAVDLHRARDRARRHHPRLVDVPAQQPPTDEAALDAAEALWLASRIADLPEREQQVFRQRAAGYSAGEAAARLSLSYKAAESAFTRARGRMRAWATAGTLLVLDYLRRLRQRPGTAALAASMLVMSAGVLLFASLPRHTAQAAGPPPASTATSHEHWLAATRPVSAHLQAAAVAAQGAAWRAARPPASPPATAPRRGGGALQVAAQDLSSTVQANSIHLAFSLGLPLPDVPVLP